MADPVYDPYLNATSLSPGPPQIGLKPVIDVGNSPAGTVPGEAGSGFRPVQVGPVAQPGAAMSSQAVPPQPQSGGTGAEGGAVVPAATPASTAGTATPSPSVYDPYANLTPEPVPAEVRGQEMRNQPWYQSLNDAVHGATGAVSHGATFGLDEIVAPLLPAIVQSLRTGQKFSEAYDDQVARMRQPRANLEEQHPIAGNALEFGGNVGTGNVFKPLFAPARVGPVSLPQRTLDYARNVTAGTGVAAGTSFTSAAGDVGQRAEAAKEGAEFGLPVAALGPAAASMAGKAYQGVRRAATPTSQIPTIAGRIVQEDVGPSPSVKSAPIPSVELNLPQVTGSTKAARTLDTLNSIDTAAAQQQRSDQNAQMLNALKGRTSGEPGMHTETGQAVSPEQTAARGSTAATRALQRGAEIIDSEEKRLWNTPALDQRPISTYTTKNIVDREIARIRRDEPGLGLAFNDSPQLQRVWRGLHMMPQKTPANEINKISSDFRAIARNQNYDGDVRRVAKLLANAAQDGIWQAPEVQGLAPMTAAELEAMRNPIPPPAPRSGAAATVGGATPPRRPVDAVTALIENGGVKDPGGEYASMDTDVGRHRDEKGRWLSRLVNNETGMSPNEARTFLFDHGYLTAAEAEDERIGHSIVGDHLAGNRRYRLGDAAEAAHWEQVDREAAADAEATHNLRSQVQDVADQHGIRVSPEELDHAARLLADDYEMHPEEALIHATNATHEQIAEWEAQRNAFGPAGMPPGTMADQLPDMQQSREGVKADPEIRRDLERARAFTKREAEVLGHASFDNILRRNSYGNATVMPGTALSRFFDFANGVERPGDIRRVGQFLDDIRSEWLKLRSYDQAGLYDPAAIEPVRRDLEDGARNYIMGKMLDAISSTERDMTGNRMLQFRQAMDWLDTNHDMLERTGLFTGDQMDLLKRFRATAELLQRDKELARTANSATFTRAADAQRFVDVFTGPLTGRFLGAGVGAAFGGLLTSWLGEAAIGTIIGAELGGILTGQQVLRAIYAAPRQKLLEALGDAYRNPKIAHDLAQRVGAAGTTRPSADTVNWIRGLVASGAGSLVGRYSGETAQPETVN